MKVIKNTEVIADNWLLIREPAVDDLPQGDLIVPFSFWKDNEQLLTERNSDTGIWIDGSTDVEEIVDYLDRFSLIALDFPVFTDGRCYSYARLLKERYHYTGDVRAIGDVLRDQLFYMKRCGFDSFQLREDKDYEDAVNGLKDFSVTYQGAVDNSVPIYRRR